MTNYNEPGEIINNFDLSAVKVYYDGNNIIGSLVFMRTIKFWSNHITTLTTLTDKSKLRIVKLAKKGMRFYINFNPRKCLINYFQDIMTRYNYSQLKFKVDSFDAEICSLFRISKLNSNDGLSEFYAKHDKYNINNLHDNNFNDSAQINYFVMDGRITIDNEIIKIKLNNDTEIFKIMNEKTLHDDGIQSFFGIKYRSSGRIMDIEYNSSEKIVFDKIKFKGKILWQIITDSCGYITEAATETSINNDNISIEVFIDEML